ncbi:ATP-binding protein [Rhizobium sp. Root1220]|uniref:sensor histidine kinase n=1 Tax=Rhizobium sp. Root1220 TaxID=1736432 RepID=UPI001FCCCAF5|nr:ATP-binding protein [Rhizobium sp. Root1220]
MESECEGQVIAQLLTWMRTRSPSIQFLFASGALILFATVISGYAVSRIVAQNAIRSKADAAAIFVQSMTEPLVQGLMSGHSLSANDIARLNGLFTDPALRDRFPHVEIWKPDGQIIYSLSQDLIGRTFELPVGVRNALSGEVSLLVADLSAGEHVARNFQTSYLEIYSPLRDNLSGQIIAVAEIQEDLSIFDRDLIQVRLASWATVAIGSSAILLCLFAIVRRASNTIEEQRQALRQRAEEAEAASRKLMELQNIARQASMELAERNEKLMRGVGADLHDGPAQLLGFARLQVEQVRQAKTAAGRKTPLAMLEDSLDGASAEIRAIARSLILPEIEHLMPGRIIERAIKLHETRSGTEVAFVTNADDREIPAALKICLFRFVQEGLSNAYRHAGGNCQAVRYEMSTAHLEVVVSDKGPPKGFTAPARQVGGGMGIYGLRQRIESLGGSLQIAAAAGNGTRLTMLFELRETA